MNCPNCTGEMVKARATNFGEEYDWCRTCKKELQEMDKPSTPIFRDLPAVMWSFGYSPCTPLEHNISIFGAASCNCGSLEIEHSDGSYHQKLAEPETNLMMAGLAAWLPALGKAPPTPTPPTPTP